MLPVTGYEREVRALLDHRCQTVARGPNWVRRPIVFCSQGNTKSVLPYGAMLTLKIEKHSAGILVC